MSVYDLSFFAIQKEINEIQQEINKSPNSALQKRLDKAIAIKNSLERYLNYTYKFEPQKCSHNPQCKLNLFPQQDCPDCKKQEFLDVCSGCNKI